MRLNLSYKGKIYEQLKRAIENAQKQCNKYTYAGYYTADDDKYIQEKYKNFQKQGF